MPTTPTYGLRYESLDDLPDGPHLGEFLAEDVEAQIVRLDAAIPFSGAVTVESAIDSTDRTTTSAAYTTAVTAANICGVVFVAPTSGRVLVHMRATVNLSANAFSFTAYDIKAGNTIGSGTSFQASDDSRAIRHDLSTRPMTHGGAFFVSGLTPGAQYNASMTHKIGGGAVTMTVGQRAFIIEPCA